MVRKVGLRWGPRSVNTGLFAPATHAHGACIGLACWPSAPRCQLCPSLSLSLSFSLSLRPSVRTCMCTRGCACVFVFLSRWAECLFSVVRPNSNTHGMATITAGKDALDTRHVRQPCARPGSVCSRSPVMVCPVKCYACLSANHTQNTCPLRRCTVCGMYSHIATQCMNPFGEHRHCPRAGGYHPGPSRTRLQSSSAADVPGLGEPAAGPGSTGRGGGTGPESGPPPAAADAGRWMVLLAPLPASARCPPLPTRASGGSHGDDDEQAAGL
jgi:hypothetical protein